MTLLHPSQHPNAQAAIKRDKARLDHTLQLIDLRVKVLRLWISVASDKIKLDAYKGSEIK